MPWKECNRMNERMKFVVRLEDGERMTNLCKEFGISRKSGYKIWNRYLQKGPDGLFDGPWVRGPWVRGTFWKV
mgnify:CR=1 FL=1|jgi:hypothetical protein